MSTLIGKKFGQYEIVALMGRGGMAAVYRARQASVEREVAVKFLPETFAEDEGLRNRFRREAKTIANLQHPHILPLFDYGEEDGLPYLVMRLVEGGTLEDRLKGEKLSLSEIARVIEQVASALDYAHARQVVHRDLKPGNILLDANLDAYLADFGVAKILSSQSVTGSGLVGTPYYMAPEQIQGQPVDPRMDIYALGVILYQALLGELPHAGETHEVLIKKLTGPPRSPIEIDPGFSPALEAVLMRALAINPEERYASAGELAQDFKVALHSMETREGVAIPSFLAESSTSPPVTVPSAPNSSQAAGVVVTQPAAQPTLETAAASPVAQPTAPVRIPKRNLFLVIGGFASLTILIVAIIFAVNALRPGPPVKMMGEFNIAVAEFAVENGSGSLPEDAGEVVAQQIYQRVSNGLADASHGQTVLYEVWPPDQTGVVAGETAEARAGAAAQLTMQIGADIIVYGVIVDDGKAQTFRPQFYITERAFAKIPEFIGEHALGGSIILGGTDDLSSRVKANRAIAGRTQAMAFMALGIAAYDLGDYQEAFDQFSQAAQMDEWPDDRGKESVYLMIGNAAAKLDQTDEAKANFERALAINPEYARAHIGLGEVYFRRALGIPPVQDPADISQDDLRQAESEFAAANAASDQPTTADIGPKVAFGLGRLAFVRYEISGRSDSNLLLQAQAYFKSIIATADAGNTRITEQAALAHGYLGTIAFLQGDYQKAQAEYQTAINTTISPRVKAGFLAQMGDLYASQNEIEQAIEAYEQAVAIAPEDARPLYQQKLDQLRGKIQPQG